VQSDLREEIHLIMDRGGIAETIPQVNGIALLDDSLNLAAFPPSENEPFQSTDSPTLSPTATVPISGLTEEPTQPPTAEPTSSPTTVEPTTAPPSKAPLTREPVSIAPSTLESTGSAEPHAITYSPTFESHQSETTQPSGPPTLESTETLSLVPTTAPSEVSNTPAPTPGPTVEAQYYRTSDKESILEKIPIWGWILIVLGVCICCTYTDPDDEDTDSDRARRRSMRSQNSQRGVDESAHQDKDNETQHDSEHHGEEYYRKLYRQ
jgi:hypothetical protein